MLKETDIVGELMGAGCDTCENVQHTGIHFSGIGLAGYGVSGLEAHLLSDHRIDFVDGLLISVEELQEAGLGSGGSLGAEKL